MTEVKKTNPLGVDKIDKLLIKFATPSVVAMVVNAVYNMVDQICIGRKVGTLGNSATNVAFPITTIAMAIALTIGQGGASKQNLELGAGNRKKAEHAVGNIITFSSVVSIIVTLLSFIFLSPMLKFFGATKTVMPYALDYASRVIWGMPALIVGTSINNTIRADGSPMFSMLSMSVGAVVNTVLDIIFVFPLNMGMKGAALATIIGQYVVCFVSLSYVKKYKNLTITKKCLKLKASLCKTICTLGVASGINQLSMFIVQVVLNNSMKYYGAKSIYGSDIPIACTGIVMKVNMLVMAIMIGIAQGTQPIVSFNYGAKKLDRVKKVYILAAKVILMIGIVCFVVFQVFPDYIIRIFGNGSKEYFEFSRKCMKIILFMTLVNGLQPLTTIFFTSIGKAVKGAFIALTRQIILLLPLVVILPKFMGIDGILYAAPIADFSAFLFVVGFIVYEFKLMNKKI